MFWGLIMEPQKRYSQTVKKAFHISMASLDLTSCTDDIVQVMCGYDNRKYLLCTLQKDKVFQCQLDLNFEVGNQVSFITNGGSHVHLTGYLVPEDEDFSDLMGEEEEEDEEEETLVTGKIRTRQSENKGDLKLNGLSAKMSKKLAALSKDAPPAKKFKTMELLQACNDEEDEEDSDVHLSMLEEEDSDEDDTDLNDTTIDELEEDDDDDDEDDDEEDEDDEDDDEDDDDEEEDDEEDFEMESDEPEEKLPAVKPKQNGTPKAKAEKTKAEKIKAKQDTKSPQIEKKQQQQAKSPQKKTVEGGVVIEDIRPGTGQVAKSGRMVQVYYEGRLKSNNKMFDSATKGNGFKFRLGTGEVIKGWDIGVKGMRVGGKRRITCPPNMAYGREGSMPAIPPNSTLVFEVELKNTN